MGEKVDIIKVAESSLPTGVTRAIINMMLQHSFAKVQAVGAGAVNQAIKAIVHTRAHLEGHGFDIIVIPEFTTGDFLGISKTAIRFTVMKMPDEVPPLLVSISQMTQDKLVKVAAGSKPKAVAGAIAGIMREQEFAEIQVVGAGAVNQAVKSIAIARRYLGRDGFDIIAIPKFTRGNFDDLERTAVRLTVLKMSETVHDLLISLK